MIDKERASETVKHPFMKKVLKKLETERHTVTCYRPNARSIAKLYTNFGKEQSFPAKIQNMVRLTLSTLV